MGTDISGWVDIHTNVSDGWAATIRVDDIAHRSYGMFASLFGVRNGGEGATAVGRFRAIAPGRSMPDDASVFCWDEFVADQGLHATWVLWSELAAIDWEEEGKSYLDEASPHLVYVKSAPGRRHERRGDYLSGGWATLFKLMATLAEQLGADNVRLTVWFDQ